RTAPLPVLAPTLGSRSCFSTEGNPGMTAASKWLSDIIGTSHMTDPKHEPLVLDLVEWIAKEPRDYAEVMEAWRTSCPRLAIWEDASDRGFVGRERVADRLLVVATALGRRLLETNGRRSAG